MEQIQKIAEMLTTRLNIKELDMNATLASLKLDSLDVVELLLDLEVEFGIVFETEETKSLKTVNDLQQMIIAKLNNK